MQKPKHFVTLCQNNPKYWNAWEEGRGPGQVAPVGTKEDIPPRGVGTILKKLLGCSCKLDYETINNWGPDECESRLEEIVSMTCTAHRKNGKISEDSARRLIRMAIGRARKESEDANYSKA